MHYRGIAQSISENKTPNDSVSLGSVVSHKVLTIYCQKQKSSHPALQVILRSGAQGQGAKNGAVSRKKCLSIPKNSPTNELLEDIKGIVNCNLTLPLNITQRFYDENGGNSLRVYNNEHHDILPKTAATSRGDTLLAWPGYHFSYKLPQGGIILAIT